MTENFKIDEADVSKAIISNFMEELHDLTETDVIIVGAGPSGLVAATELAKNNIKTLIMERNIKPGGGMFLGGMLMNKLVVEHPAQELLREAGVKTLKPYKEKLFVANAYEVSAKLMISAFDAGAKLLNGVEVVDVIYRKEGIKGVVANWHAVSSLPSWITCVDPLAFKSRVVIDATGHNAEVAKIAGEKLGFAVKGKEGSMWVEQAEKATIESTNEIYPGLIVTGMAANGAYGLPRMGPIFGAMFLSGIKAAKIALEIVSNKVPVEV